MDKSCYVNNEIHLNLAKKFSNEFEQREQAGIRGEININLCDGFQTYKHSDENYYCIFHLPNKDKNIEEFREASEKVITKIQNRIKQLNDLPDNKKKLEKAKIKYDFRYVWFPCAFGFRGKPVDVEINFSHATFFDVADFMNTEFVGYANFDSVTFHKLAYFIFAKFQANAYFYDARFLGESDFKYTFFSNGKFTKAVFSESADFESSEFARHANFIGTTFVKEANFKHSKLFIANFRDANFSDVVNFESAEFLSFVIFRGNSRNLVFNENAILNLQNAMIDKPEKISFHTVRLEPNWFVDIDAKKFVFTICYWQYSDNDKIKLATELQKLSSQHVENPHKHLTKTCWQLADNHEESKSFVTASDFRKFAQESYRQEDENKVKIWSLQWWYWLSSNYGESPLKAVGIWGIIILLYAIAYYFADFKVRDIQVQLSLIQAILQSLATATFQNIEYIKPNSNTSVFLMISEKIIAPLQAALLALAIRRKFMR